MIVIINNIHCHTRGPRYINDDCPIGDKKITEKKKLFNY